MSLDRVLAAAHSVLRNDEADPDANFFALGGDSVQAIGFADRLGAELGVELDVVDVLECPSLRDLARLLDERRSGPSAGPEPLIRPVAPSAHHPASPVQRSLYLLDRLTSPADKAVLPTLLWFSERLAAEPARAAFAQVLARHEILRTGFVMVDGDVAQVVRDPDGTTPGFFYTDVRSDPGTAADLVGSVYERETTAPMDLATGPLARLHLVVLPEGTVGVLTLHHIVSDDFSAGVVQADFRLGYQGADLAPPLPFQYKDYTAWLTDWCRGPHGQQALEYWARTPAVREDARFFPHPATETGSVAAARLDLPLEREAYSALSRASAEHEATTFTVLAACVRALLFDRTGRQHGALGVAMSTSGALGSAHIGPYVNTVPIAAEITSGTTFRQLVAELGRATVSAFKHRVLPAELISERVAGGRPLFDAGFTLQKRDSTVPVGPPVDECSDSLGIRLLFAAFEEPDAITIRIRYQTAHFDRTAILALHRRLAEVIRTVCAAKDTALAELFATAGEFDLDLDF